MFIWKLSCVSSCVVLREATLSSSYAFICGVPSARFCASSSSLSLSSDDEDDDDDDDEDDDDEDEDAEEQDEDDEELEPDRECEQDDEDEEDEEDDLEEQDDLSESESESELESDPLLLTLCFLELCLFCRHRFLFRRLRVLFQIFIFSFCVLKSIHFSI